VGSSRFQFRATAAVSAARGIVAASVGARLGLPAVSVQTREIGYLRRTSREECGTCCAPMRLRTRRTNHQVLAFHERLRRGLLSVF